MATSFAASVVNQVLRDREGRVVDSDLREIAVTGVYQDPQGL